jgi:hypothetical protein
VKRSLRWYVAALPDLVGAFSIEPGIDRSRLREGPKPLIERLRLQGLKRRTRGEAERSRLRYAIALAERLRRREPNCYRRVLMEIAMDGGAAREQVFLALQSGGGTGSGHAFLASHPDVVASSYDAVFAM